jgi:hypothetical protein
MILMLKDEGVDIATGIEDMMVTDTEIDDDGVQGQKNNNREDDDDDNEHNEMT